MENISRVRITSLVQGHGSNKEESTMKKNLELRKMNLEPHFILFQEPELKA